MASFGRIIPLIPLKSVLLQRQIRRSKLRDGIIGRRAIAVENRCMTDDLAFTSAVELAALTARRAVSPVEIVDRVLARIERSRPTLNAFITVCAEEARAAALFEAARPWAARRPPEPAR
jgi:hypothetical protein